MAGPMIRENPLTTLRYPSACNWSGPTISEQGIMASGTWIGRINRSKTWPHPNMQLHQKELNLLTERRPDRVESGHQTDLRTNDRD